MTTRKRKLRKRPGWYLVVTLLLLVGGYGAIKSGQGLYRVWRLSRMMRQEEKAYREDLARKEALETEIEMLTNDSTYIEEIARREYGMKKKGEKVFQITLPDSNKGAR